MATGAKECHCSLEFGGPGKKITENEVGGGGGGVVPVYSIGDTWLANHSSSTATRIYGAGICSSIGTAGAIAAAAVVAEKVDGGSIEDLGCSKKWWRLPVKVGGRPAAYIS